MQYCYEKLIIIDGYNVLRTCKKYSSLVGNYPNFEDYKCENLNAAREALLNDVVILSNKKTKIIIVYDAANNHDLFIPRKQLYHNVILAFTKPFQSADQYIEKYVFEHKQSNKKIIVVTNDNQIEYTTINNKNVTKMTTDNFIQYTSEAKLNYFNYSKPDFSKTIESQVDDITYQKLLALRDSL